MIWIAFALGAVLAWGMYGPALHKGQVLLGSPLRALLCVGFAYFLLGVLVPVASLATSPGGIGSFPFAGSIWATIGGALGAIGAILLLGVGLTGLWAIRAWPPILEASGYTLFAVCCAIGVSGFDLWQTWLLAALAIAWAAMLLAARLPALARPTAGLREKLLYLQQ